MPRAQAGRNRENTGDPGLRPTHQAKQRAARRLTNTALSDARDDGMGSEDEDEDTDEYIQDEYEDEDEEGSGTGRVQGVRWLRVGERFPWGRAVFHLDGSLGEDTIAHVKKRVKKAGGQISSSPSAASVILINPHPSVLPLARITHLSSLDKIKSHEAAILSYHWLSRCYFSKRVEEGVRAVPAFIGEEGLGLRVAVGKFEGVQGDKERRDIMVDLEKNGAIVVDPSIADLGIVPESHPFLSSPPKDDARYRAIQWRSSAWVAQKVERARRAEQKENDQDRSKLRSQIGMKVKAETKRRDNGKKKAVSMIAKKAVKNEPTASSRLKDGRRSTTRTEFTAHDRDMLARWLAYKRPEKTGRTTRSLYKQLENYQPTHPNFKWASRHPASAWHEHFKRGRAKIGVDDKVLEDEVERYVQQGANSRLRTTTVVGRKKAKAKGEEVVAEGRVAIGRHPHPSAKSQGEIADEAEHGDGTGAGSSKSRGSGIVNRQKDARAESGSPSAKASKTGVPIRTTSVTGDSSSDKSESEIAIDDRSLSPAVAEDDINEIHDYGESVGGGFSQLENFDKTSKGQAPREANIMTGNEKGRRGSGRSVQDEVAERTEGQVAGDEDVVEGVAEARDEAGDEKDGEEGRKAQQIHDHGHHERHAATKGHKQEEVPGHGRDHHQNEDDERSEEEDYESDQDDPAQVDDIVGEAMNRLPEYTEEEKRRPRSIKRCRKRERSSVKGDGEDLYSAKLGRKEDDKAEEKESEMSAEEVRRSKRVKAG